MGICHFLFSIIALWCASIASSNIRNISIHTRTIAKRIEDDSIHVIQLSATHMIPDSVTIEDSITKFCSSLRFMDNADCRHCLTTNIEMQLIDGTRPKQWKDRNPGSEGIPFKDRTVRELSRIYRDIERNHSVKQICLIGSIEEQILRLLTIFLHRRKDLRMSLTVVGYGEHIPTNENVEILKAIVDSIVDEYSLAGSQIYVNGWAASDKELDVTSFATCDVLHIQNVSSPYDMEYDNFMGASKLPRLLSKDILWNIIRAKQQANERNNIERTEMSLPGTLVILESADKESFEKVTPAAEAIPEDVREYFKWLGSAITMDGTVVGFHQMNVTDEGSTCTCGKQIHASSDIAISEFYSTLYLGRIQPLKGRPRPQTSATVDSYPTWKQQTLILISFSSSIFLETARGIRFALIQHMGFLEENVIITGYVTLKDILQANKYNSAIQIVIGAHQGENWLLPKYVLFHTENHWNTYSSKSETYAALLKNAEAVMVYSSAHLGYIRQIRLSNVTYSGALNKEEDVREAIVPFFSESVYYQADIVVENREKKVRVRAKTDESSFLPDGYRPILPWVHASWGNESYSRIFDITAIGTLQGRRAEFAKELVFHYYFLGGNQLISIPNRPVLSLNCKFGIVNPQTGEKLPGHPLEAIGNIVDAADIHTRETLNVLSHITLNVHQKEEAVFETHRINHLLSLGQAVISERTSYFDTAAMDTHQWLLEDTYEEAQAVLMVNNWTEMFQMAGELYLPRARTRLQKQQVTAWQFYHDRVATNVTAFDNLLYHIFKRSKTASLRR